MDEEDIVRDCNAAARSLLPELSVDTPVDAAMPNTEPAGTDGRADASGWTGRSEILSFDRDGRTRYYAVNETELTVGPHSVGRAVVITDVTQVERQRRELKRQAEQLDGFAAAVAHELRNTLTIADANLALVSEALEQGRAVEATEMVETISEANARMTEIVGDLTTLARLSQSVTDPPLIQFAPAVERAYGAVDAGDVTLHVEGDGQVRADETRVQELVRNAARLAVMTGASELVTEIRDGEIRVEVRGESMTVTDTEGLFEYGAAVPTAEAGMCGPNIQTLARAHGWEVTAGPLQSGGIEVVITGVAVDHLTAEASGDRVAE